jgi:hypothetical protein
MSIKMQDSRLNHLPQMHTFASMRSTPFMEIDDKGGEIVQRYESFEIEIVQGEEIRYESFGRGLRQRSRGWTWTWTKREQR